MKFKSKVIRFRMCLVSIGGNIPTHTRKPKLVIPSGQTSSIQRDLNINIQAPLSLSNLSRLFYVPTPPPFSKKKKNTWAMTNKEFFPVYLQRCHFPFNSNLIFPPFLLIIKILGFAGTNCQENVNDCPGHLCQNGATCVDGVNSYTCQCPPSFTGPYCNQDVDECALRPSVCKNGATCTNTHGGFSCICVNGWTGSDCSENIDDCAGAACFNGATCHDRVGSFFCQCAPGTAERE